MKRMIMALAVVVLLAGSAHAWPRGVTVVRRGVFGRTVVVNRRAVVVNRAFGRVVLVNPGHFQSRVFVDSFGRATFARPVVVNSLGFGGVQVFGRGFGSGGCGFLLIP